MREKVRKKEGLAVAMALVLLITLGYLPDAFAQALKIQSFKTHSRLSIGIDEGVKAQWKNSKQGFELLLKGIGLADLGAPLGDEGKWLEQFKVLQDPNLTGLRISESAAGVRIEGKWKYPTGVSALADPQMDFFEFRDASATPRYVVDFWPKKGPTLREVQAARAQAARLAEMKKSESLTRKRAERRIANEQLRAESDDVANFCREPLSEATDVFLPLLPFHEKVDFGKWLSIHTPDENFSYYRPSGKDKESQYIRLALELYRQGKSALVLRTLDFFEQEFPRSDRGYEMRFLRANAMLKLDLETEAEKILNQLTVDAKSSPVAVYSAMYIAGHQMHSGSPLAALESFLWLINQHPEHRLSWVFHLGAAEALYSLKQTDRAAKEYQWIAENAPNQRAKAQAALRIGDLYLDRFQYEQALAAYYQGLSRFQAEAKEFPGVFINRGETLYQLGQFDRAEEVFKQFLADFPAHPSGWRASLRLGEITGRRRDAVAATASRKWFYETINSYPTSPGATLARLRLVSCGDHGGFDLAALDRFMTGDAEKFDGHGELSTKRYRDLRGLAYVRALVTLGREDRAVTLALDEMAKNPLSETRTFLRRIIGSLFRKTILNYLAEGRRYEALAFYQEKKDMITRDIPVFQLDYLLKLSQAASDLGLGSVARQLVATYEKAAVREEGTASERNLASAGETFTNFEVDPEAQARAWERAFSKAKALWVSAGIRGESRDEIRALLAKVGERSRYAFEREIMLGLIDEHEGKLTAALAHAAKAQILRPSDSTSEAGNDISLETWLASLQARSGDPKLAFEMYRNLEKVVENSKSDANSVARTFGVPSPPSLETIYLAQGELLEKMARWGEAGTVYAKLVEKGWGGNRALFSYAKVLIKSGSLASEEKGRNAMRKLASSEGNDFWKRLAKETLANDTTAKEGGK